MLGEDGLLFSCSVLTDLLGPHGLTSWTAARQASLSFTISRSLLRLTSIELVMLSYHLIFCLPLVLLPSVFPSIRVFSMSQFFASGINLIHYWAVYTGIHLCLVCLTLQPHGLKPARFLCSWDFLGKNAGGGCHFLLQGIFPTQE